MIDINVEKYEFEPIKSYPMLNWKGKRPFRSTQYYPAQLKEVYGQEDENGWINKVFWGDNLQVMSHLLKKFRGKIDLIYIDPPFDSKADYKKKIKLKDEEVHNQTVIFVEDIHKNEDSEKAWEQLKNDDNINVSIDLFYCGLLFFRKEQAKEHFKIRN